VERVTEYCYPDLPGGRGARVDAEETVNGAIEVSVSVPASDNKHDQSAG